tara:strand:- start:59 stop:304 length:246 start_codon:yes stop_codon:yes gene_type:complete
MSKISLEKILSIIAKNINEEPNNLNLNSESKDFYYWDSISQVTILLEIEKVTGKKLNSDGLLELDSVKKIVSELRKKNVYL